MACTQVVNEIADRHFQGNFFVAHARLNELSRLHTPSVTSTQEVVEFYSHLLDPTASSKRGAVFDTPEARGGVFKRAKKIWQAATGKDSSKDKKKKKKSDSDSESSSSDDETEKHKKKKKSRRGDMFDSPEMDIHDDDVEASLYEDEEEEQLRALQDLKLEQQASGMRSAHGGKHHMKTRCDDFGHEMSSSSSEMPDESDSRSAPGFAAMLSNKLGLKDKISLNFDVRNVTKQSSLPESVASVRHVVDGIGKMFIGASGTSDQFWTDFVDAVNAKEAYAYDLSDMVDQVIVKNDKSTDSTAIMYAKTNISSSSKVNKVKSWSVVKDGHEVLVVEAAFSVPFDWSKFFRGMNKIPLKWKEMESVIINVGDLNKADSFPIGQRRFACTLANSAQTNEAITEHKRAIFTVNEVQVKLLSGAEKTAVAMMPFDGQQFGNLWFVLQLK